MSVTIREVALRAKVSVKTVSRIINNEPLVRENTREKVQLAMAELGYTPSILAQRFARGRSHVVGLLVHRGNISEYVADILRGLMEVCSAEGYGVSIFSYRSDEPDAPNGVLHLVRQQYVDGLIFTPGCDNSPDLLASLEELNTPFVCIWPQNITHSYPHIATQDRQGAYELTSYLISLGHRRIGFITGEMDHSDSAERLNGFKAALNAHRIEFDPALVQYGDFSFPVGVMAGRALLKLPNPPTAIFASNDDMAVGVYHAADQLRISIPTQLSVAGFDDSRLATRILPPLTTVRQPIAEMARLAAQLLIRQLNGEDVTNGSFVLSTSLVIRNSTAPVDARSTHR